MLSFDYYFLYYFHFLSFFYRATLCISTVFAVGRCPSVCLSVRHDRLLYPDD